MTASHLRSHMRPTFALFFTIACGFTPPFRPPVPPLLTLATGSPRHTGIPQQRAANGNNQGEVADGIQKAFLLGPLAFVLSIVAQGGIYWGMANGKIGDVNQYTRDCNAWLQERRMVKPGSARTLDQLQADQEITNEAQLRWRNRVIRDIKEGPDPKSLRDWAHPPPGGWWSGSSTLSGDATMCKE